MFTIGNDEQMMEFEVKHDNELALMLHERDHYRNALIVLCGGKREAVRDAMSNALNAYTKKYGWEY
jgi:hypothetical protein